MKKTFLFLIIFFITIFGYSQIPSGYYNNAQGLTETALKTALHNIIDNHTVVSYSSLITHHQTTDKKPNNKVWDMYSDIPGGTPPYQFIFVTDKCGNYAKEGDCYNREHSWPQSWFNSSSPMKSDLFHVYPTDGYVNGKRSNYPFGEVANATWTSQNGSKVGPCSSALGYSGIVFEPIDEYKGDFARTYFYMTVRYFNEDSNWLNNDMVNGAEIKSWALIMLLQWHQDDTVSTKELNRNNAVYSIQGNRNPFIDHPEYSNLIWGTPSKTVIKNPSENDIIIYPNPVNDYCTISFSNIDFYENFNIMLYDIMGKQTNISLKRNNNKIILNTENLPKGIYFLKIQNSTKSINYYKKLIKGTSNNYFASRFSEFFIDDENF